MRQYFVGTSIAEIVSLLPNDRMRSQLVVGGASVRGSCDGGGGGNFWRFLGRIYLDVNFLHATSEGEWGNLHQDRKPRHGQMRKSRDRICMQTQSAMPD